ncbi:MAG: hypothetical protein Q9222_004682 [Ikaeria aurantiellina]
MGYGVIVPDLLGYGGTDKPMALEWYKLKSMSDDIASLLNNHQIEEVLAVGHDWGSFLLSRLANYHPERISAYVFLSVGYKPPMGTFDVDDINDATQKRFGYPMFKYWHFFDSPDAAEIMDGNPASSTSIIYPHDPEVYLSHLCPVGALRRFYQNGTTLPRPVWITAEELSTHSEIFSPANGGYGGALNWYKSCMANVNAADEDAIPKEKWQITKPVLLVSCTRDHVAIPELQEETMSGFVASEGGLEIKKLDAGHWVMLEKKDEVNEILRNFFERQQRGGRNM